MGYGIQVAKDGSSRPNSLGFGIIEGNRTVLICGGSICGLEEMARRADSIQLPRELVADLLESSLRFQEVAETLEVQLDKKTVKRLKTGHRELKKRQYKVASSREDIDRILSS